MMHLLQLEAQQSTRQFLGKRSYTRRKYFQESRRLDGIDDRTEP